MVIGRKGGVFSFFLLCHFSFFLSFFLGEGGEEEGGRGGEREEVKKQSTCGLFAVSLALLFCVVPEPCVGDINQLASVCLCIGRIG